VKIRFQIKHPSGYLLLQGLRLMVRDWPCLLWAWIISIPFCLFAASPFRLAAGLWMERQAFAANMSHFLGNRVAAAEDLAVQSRQFAGKLSWASLLQFDLRTSGPRFLLQVPKGLWYAIALEIAALLFVVAGTLYVYLATEPPQPGRVFKYSARYILRFLRALIFGTLIAAPIFFGLIAARHGLLALLGTAQSARTALLYSGISMGLVVLSGLVLLLFVDLVEAHAMRRSIRGHHAVRESILPAMQLVFHQFFWISPTFLLPYAVSAGSLVATFCLWKSLVLTNRLWIAYLSVQLGFFLMLAARFWQRGMEVALIVAVERSMSVANALSENHETQPQEAQEAKPSKPEANPTLQELVQKLKKEPWAKTDVPPLKTLFPEALPQPKKTPAPASAIPSGPSLVNKPATPTAPPPAAPVEEPAKTSPAIPKTAAESLLAEHAKKTSLLDATSEEPATPAKTGPQEKKTETSPPSKSASGTNSRKP
jgi:hypothetical protein